MTNFLGFDRYCRTCKHKLPVFLPMVYFKPNSIPKLRNFLPFVNQTGSFPFEQKTNVSLSHLPILLLLSRVIHIDNTFGLLLSRGCFTTSFRSLYQYSTHRFQLISQKLIRYPFLIFHASYFSAKIAYFFVIHIDSKNIFGNLTQNHLEIWRKIIWKFGINYFMG